MPSGARLASLLSGALSPPASLSHPVFSEVRSWGSPYASISCCLKTTGSGQHIRLHVLPSTGRSEEVLISQIRGCVETQLNAAFS